MLGVQGFWPINRVIKFQIKGVRKKKEKKRVRKKGLKKCGRILRKSTKLSQIQFTHCHTISHALSLICT